MRKARYAFVAIALVLIAGVLITSHAGDILARLSAVELTAQADQARAALASATANRNNVYAGVRREQVDSLKAAIANAGSRLDYVQAQLT